MTIAVADQVQMAAIKESTFGEQVTGSNLQLVRFTSESLAQNQSTTVSAEIRPDRQVSNIVRTNLSSGGDLSFELSATTYDDFFKSVLMADTDWSAPVIDIAGEITISAAVTDNSFNDSGSGLIGYDVGEWIYVEGFAAVDSVNNGFFKILTVAAGKITVAGGVLADEAAGDSVSITQMGSITNGKTSEFWDLERTYTDLTSELALFTGIMFDTLALEFATEAIITGTLGTIGKKEESIAASGGIGYDLPTTTVPMNVVDDIAKVVEFTGSIQITSASLSLGNNLRARTVLGELGAISVGAGKVEMTGSVQAYYESKDLYEKFLNQTESSLAIMGQDAAGNAYVFEMPQIKYQEGGRPASGENSDIMADLSFTAYMDPVELVTVRIARLAV